ncbi:MAG: DUF4271 domain-containing protein [Bacteroidales bacterium]|nr:DUF4271 domain-containing protein [Bacteroidales bacterium]
MHLLYLNANYLLPVIEKQTDYAQYYVMGVSILLFTTYIIIKVLFSGYYQNLFYVALKQDNLRSSFKESNSAFKQADLYILIAALLSLVTGIFTIINYYPMFNNDSFLVNHWVLFLSILSFVLLVLVLKWAVYSYFGWILDLSNFSKNYLSSFFYSIRIYGIINFPIFIFVPFVGETMRIILIYSMLSTIAIVVLYNFYTYWRQTIKIKFFNHYSILYFCTLEILPILILIRIVGNFERFVN